jgi:protein phosphatase
VKDISQVIREALKVKAEEFLSVIDELLSLLTDEMKKTKKLEINGRLVKVEPTGEAVVVGDIHGDIESLAYILKNCNFLESKDMLLVFLGDYGDRGAYSAEVYYTVIKLKLDHPEKVVLMRGNHEGPEDLLAYPHDLPIQFRARFGEKGTLAYTKIRQLFNYLYNAVYIKKRLLMVHGGLPAQAKSLEDIASAHKTHPQKTFLEEILWSDPHEGINGIVASPRGAGKLFGLDVTRRLLKILNAKLLIRGHEPSREGFKINHNRILTLFSRKGPPYYNMFGAYLQVQLSKEFENAEQLIPYVHRF